MIKLTLIKYNKILKAHYVTPTTTTTTTTPSSSEEKVVETNEAIQTR